MFKHDLEVIDALRRDAVNVREPHPSGIKKLQAYAGQLVWVGGKFPIDVSITRCWLIAKLTVVLDWRRLLLVSCSWIQYRSTYGAEQLEVRAHEHPLQPRLSLLPACD